MPLIVRTISDQAYHFVRERILSGAWEAGAPLRQDTIAEELGISKIPLREALSRLEQDGLLSSSPNKGYVVRHLSPEEADEVFKLRLKLEPDTVAQAALRASDAERQAAITAFDALAEASATDGGDYVLANRLFHLTLVRPGAGRITWQIVEQLHVLAERYVRVHLEPAGRTSRAALEHRDILDAWLARDGRAVATLTASHIRWTLNDIRAQLAPPAKNTKVRHRAA